MARRWIRLTFVALALSALTLAGCGASEESGTTGEEQQGEAAVTTGVVGTVEGMFPPPFTLPDLDGGEVSLADFDEVFHDAIKTP